MEKLSKQDLIFLIESVLSNSLEINSSDIFQEGKPKASKTKSGKKVPGKYLTKDKAAMKKEIERVSKLKSDDPAAYGKWEADYKARNTKSGKPHKTKKSAATIAYEKKFGKKNENLNKLNEMDTNNEKYQECYDEIDMRLSWDKDRLPHYELDEIADTCGLEFEEVLNIFQKYLVDRDQKKYQELKNEIKNIFDEVDFYNQNYTFKDFMEYWNENNFPMDYGWASEEEIKKVFDELTINPNQLKMDLDENTDKALATKAKASGISKSILKRVYSKGAAAWKSGHRPGVSQQQWAMGRVNSFLTGKGGARKADKELWAQAKKSKKRKNESTEEILLRKKIREILNEEYINNEELEELYPMLVGEDKINKEEE